MLKSKRRMLALVALIASLAAILAIGLDQQRGNVSAGELQCPRPALL